MLEHTDAAARTGTALTYQVTAVVDGGEPVRSAVVEVTTPGNSPPLPVGTLPDRWLHVGDTASVEFGDAFEDPEGDALTYTVHSSATTVATVSVSDTQVSITPLAAGTATVTVTATDAGGSGASATQTFTVTVLSSSATDYDDDDGLIEVTTLAQLYAIRHDLDGDGAPTADGAAAYQAAFSAAGDRQACGGPNGCVGYELDANLNFDTNANGLADEGDTYWNSGAGWEPIDAPPGPSTPGAIFGAGFRAIFEGNGHTIANLFIDRGSSVGLFGRPSYSSVIRHVGLIDVDVTGSSDVGGLAGSTDGAVIGSYVTGKVSGTGEDVGGLVGANWGTPVVASYAAVEVTGGTNVGGLIGRNNAMVTASYASDGLVGSRVGGVAGDTAATQTFGVSVDGGGGGGGRRPNRPPEAVGTLADQSLTFGASPVVVDVAPAFEDSDDDELTYAATSSADDMAAVAVEGSIVTVTPAGAGTAVVTVTASDGEESNAPATQAFTVTVVVDYDADADGLIEVRTLAQLDVLRHDLDGDGVPAAAGEGAHAAAFAGAIGGLSCAGAGCRGYELLADLDFDTNGSGGLDAGDAYWNDGAGWLPIGTEAEPFAAAFEGNGRVIRHLFINGGEGAGLFGATGPSSVVARVGLIAVDVTGTTAVGALARRNGGRVTASWATGRVWGTETVGGLVGSNAGDIGGSYAAAEVSGGRQAGGLVGLNDGGLRAVHATGVKGGPKLDQSGGGKLDHPAARWRV